MAEKLIIATNKSEANQVLTQIVAIRKLIEHRDVGDIVGEPVIDFVRATPHTIRLTVTFYSKKEPPFNTREVKRAVYNVPDLIRSNADWTKIKAACGGSSGYLWGRFKAIANLDNGRQMHVHGSTKDNAIKRLKALQALSSSKILTLNCNEEIKEGLREEDKALFKPTTRMYPAYFSILSSNKIINETNNEVSLPFGTRNDNLSGSFKRRKTVKLPLYLDKEPSYIKDFITEMLRDRGTTTS